MPDKLNGKAQAFLLILRWTLAIIFFANGVPKLSDPGFGAQADSFFASLRDDVIFGPYKTVFKDVIIPNAFIIASFVKYAEIALGAMFFIGWPLRFASGLATFLHLNYLCIASFPTFIYLNVLMIVCEWFIRSVHEKQ
jgi:uncharacterized membrane protein YphA (DoxX/SURF4 family)